MKVQRIVPAVMLMVGLMVMSAPIVAAEEVKYDLKPCGSKVILSGVNSHVIMSGYGHHSADDERTTTSRCY
jgi:hypothetical protein